MEYNEIETILKKYLAKEDVEFGATENQSVRSGWLEKLSEVL